MLEGFANEGFAEVWTPVALAREVGRKPLSLNVASERVVLFRDAEGKVAALLDQCPHRGVALSLGKVGKDGCLECPFHGWRFAADGACKDVPLNPMPEEKRQRLAATAFPVRERGGLIWLYTRPGTEAPEEPAVPAALEDPRRSVWLYVTVFQAHWTRVMENMLDMPHVPFVHRRSIGAGLRAKLKPDSRMEIHLTPTPTGWHSESTLDGERNKGGLDWLRPNGMALSGAMLGGEMRLFAWCVPHDSRSTRLFVVSTRDFLRYNPLGWLFDEFSRVITLEDKAVVESSQPSELPPASEERSVATDRATLSFRRWYHERLQASFQPGTASAEPLASGADTQELPSREPLTARRASTGT